MLALDDAVRATLHDQHAADPRPHSARRALRLNLGAKAGFVA